MTNLTPVSSFDDVYQIEQADYATGGEGGTANAQAQALANRTQYLRENKADKATTLGGYGIGDAYTKSAVDTALLAKEATANKGQPNGYAGLDSSGRVPESSLPSSALLSFGIAGFSGLKIASLGINNYSSIITGNFVELRNSSNEVKVLSGVNVTASISSSGANGLDTGALAASTWYYVFLIYNPTTLTTAALFSLSATAPTLPSGYTFFARVGAVRTGSSGYLLQTLQYGRKVQYVVLTGSNTPNLPIMAQGAVGTWSASAPVYAAISTSNFAPPTALEIKLKVSCFFGGGGAFVGIAPNANYSGVTTSNPPVYSSDISASGHHSTVALLRESSNIYAYSSSAGGLIQCMGWEDNL